MEKITCKMRLTSLAKGLTKTPIFRRRSNPTSERITGETTHARPRHAYGAHLKKVRSEPVRHLPEVIELQCLIAPTGKRYYFERSREEGSLVQLVQEFTMTSNDHSLEDFLIWARTHSHIRIFQPHENPTAAVIYEEVAWNLKE